MYISLNKVIAVLASAALMVIAYYANYLPLKKSQAFIMAMRSVSQYKSLDEFKEGLARPLDIPSPIGQEELVRNMGSMVINIINTSGANNPQLVASLMEFLDNYYNPIMENGRGMSFTQNVYVLGNANQVAYLRTKDPRYLLRARDYYLRGSEIAPSRPQFLYGLLDIYRILGDREGVLKTARRILELWPQDDRIPLLVAEVESTVAVPTSTPGN